MKSHSLTASALVLGLFVTGCGPSGPELAEVSGKVTYDGQPLPLAQLNFVPRAKGAGPSGATTDKDGNYTLRYTRDESGALVGEHDVTIIPLEKPSGADAIAGLKSAGIDVTKIPKLPRKYTEAGELTAEVKRGGNQINFDLKP